MTTDTSLDEPTPDGSADEIAADVDLADGERLLGVPWSTLLNVQAVRGVGLLLVAIVVLLWPDRTDRVLAVLVGIGLGGYTIMTVLDVVRHREQRQFLTILSIAVSGGMAAALVAHPVDSLRTATQALGGLLVAYAVVEVGRTIRRRRSVAWALSKSIGLVLAGGLLMVFPATLLAAATSIVAALLGASGLIHAFRRPVDDDADGGATSPFGGLVTWLRERPFMTEDREILKQKVFFEGPSAATRFARFAALMLFASVIASVGVVVESTAVVIGAMLVAPLMVPLMGTALSVAMGWPRRMRRCAGVAVAGIVLAISTGALIGAILPRSVEVTGNTEIISRVSPTIVDLAIAVAAGAAGAYAMSRRDVSDSLPGVAVAIALVPPLTVVGLCWQQQAWAAGNGALLLFLTNAVAILIAGGSMFVLVGAVPLRRISETQQRLGTVVVGLLSVGCVVVVLLMLNGAQLARSDLARAGVDEVLAEWSAQHEDHRVVDTRVQTDGTIVVDLTGPGEPPDLDTLSDALSASAPDDVDVQVHWTEQQQRIITD